MRARSLMQVFRTLLASVEYARLPEGLDYDEVRCRLGCRRRAANKYSGRVLFTTYLTRWLHHTVYETKGLLPTEWLIDCV